MNLGKPGWNNVRGRASLASTHVADVRPLNAKTDGPYSVGEVARLLGVHVDTVRDWCVGGELACSRTAGGHRRITARAIDEMLARRLAA